MDRGLLDRLIKREAPATIEGGVDIAGYLAQQGIVYQSSAPNWVDGLPLDNGDLGALVWGKPGAGQVIHLDKINNWHTAPDGTA